MVTFMVTLCIISLKEDDNMLPNKESETLEYKKSVSELKEAIISLTAMLNKHGKGTLFFGVKPNGDLVSNEIAESTLRDISRKIYEAIEPRVYPVVESVVIEGIEVIEVNIQGSEQPYSAYGRYYIRTADEDRILGSAQLKRLIENQTFSESWEQKLTKFTMDDVDLEVLKNFYETSTKNGRLLEDEYNPKNLLTKLGLYKNNFLTNAGYLLFSNRKPITLKMAIFATDEKLTFLDIKTLEDNIFNLILDAQIYIEKNIRWTAEIVNISRVETPEIPSAALREIIVNSFAHAQYSTTTNHEIRIHPSKIVIYSPGAFNNEYSPKDYIESDLPSIIRNETITKVLYLYKAIEQFGSGFKRVHNLCLDSNIEYNYRKLHSGFEFTFIRKEIDKQDNYLNKQPQDSFYVLSEGASTTLKYLREDPTYTRDELASLLSKHIRTIQRYLDELSESGIIQRKGSKKTGYWVVKE